MMDKEKKKFVITRGVLGWGIPMALFWSFFMSFCKIGELSISAAEFEPRRFLQFLCVAIIIFPAGGYFYGLWLWRYNERLKR